MQQSNDIIPRVAGVVAKRTKKYAVIVVASEARRRSGEAFARSLARRLNEATYRARAQSAVTVSTETRDVNGVPSRTITIEMPDSATSCLVQELALPAAPDLPVTLYLGWASGSLKRAFLYLWHTARRVKAENAVQQISQAVFSVVLSFIYFFFLPLVTGIVVTPLRRLSSFVMALYAVAFLFLLGLAVWKPALGALISWIAQVTDQLIGFSHSSVGFGMLFPIIAGAVGAAIVSLLAGVLRILKALLHDNPNNENVRTISSDLSYLLDPLYAADLQSLFAERISQIGADPHLELIFLIARDRGALLAYEVLSRGGSMVAGKGVTLLTTSLQLGGFKASPAGSVLLLLDRTQWRRFSQPMPDNMSWHNFSTWPVLEQKVMLRSLSGGALLPPILESNWHRWNHGVTRSLLERMIALMGYPTSAERGDSKKMGLVASDTY